MDRHHHRRATQLLARVHGHHVRVRFSHDRRRFMVSLDTTQKFTIEVLPVQDDGTPGQIDGPPTYPASQAGILTIVPSADGLSAECRGIGVGSCTITPTASAGGKVITGPPIDVVVGAPPQKSATRLVETVGQVVPQ
jgi:hypothetical protein